MFAANESRSRPGLRHALAGIHAGVLGALAMLACVMAGSLWDNRSIWAVPNLFATTFFGSDAYRNQLVRTSWAGLALILAIYGVLGMVWGLIWGDTRKRWLPLYGVVAGLLVYLVFYDFLWKHANPLVTLYAPDRQLQVGHVLWGLILARSPKYSRHIAESMAAPSSVPPTPVPPMSTPPADVQDGAHEVRSGEVIR
ncbi:MAG: hypothetical protein ABSG41_25965 [Bryobacteraceae bacterium]|jgi:hypothetical protein